MVFNTGWCKHFCGSLILQTGHIFCILRDLKLWARKERLFRFENKYLQFFASHVAQLQ